MCSLICQIEAVSCLLKAIMIYTDMGRFSIAAKHHLTIAETYVSELADLNKAVQHYEQAADYFKGTVLLPHENRYPNLLWFVTYNTLADLGDDSNRSANKCMLKIAQYTAQLENYHKAIQIYEHVAIASLDDSLLKESTGIEENFFRAALCHLCIDVVKARYAIQQYEQMLPRFQVGQVHFQIFLCRIIPRWPFLGMFPFYRNPENQNSLKLWLDM